MHMDSIFADSGHIAILCLVNPTIGLQKCSIFKGKNAKTI